MLEPRDAHRIQIKNKINKRKKMPCTLGLRLKTPNGANFSIYPHTYYELRNLQLDLNLNLNLHEKKDIVNESIRINLSTIDDYRSSMRGRLP